MKLFAENDILELMKEFEVGGKVNITFVAVDGMLEPITMIHSTTCYLDGHIRHVYELEMFGSTILAIDGLVSKTYVAGLIASSVNYILQKVEKYNEKKDINN